MTIQPYQGSVELVSHHDDTGGRLVAWAESLSAAHQLASALCRTSFVPKHFAGKPEEAAAALMLGDELGFSPVSALRSIFVISGTPGLYAKSMVALVQSRGHQVWTETDTAAKVTVCGQRAGSDKVERSEWTIDRARRAGYTNNKKYETDPQAMLYARAASDVCRRIAADVLAGVPHTVEELELESDQPAPKKVSRRKAEPAPPMPEPDLEVPAAIEAPAAEESPYLNPQSSLAKRMFATMNEAGITDRDARLAYVSEVIGREVKSSGEMTDADATVVIDVLNAQLASKSEPPVDEAEPALDWPEAATPGDPA
jgi:hypothetical protein